MAISRKYERHIADYEFLGFRPESPTCTVGCALTLLSRNRELRSGWLRGVDLIVHNLHQHFDNDFTCQQRFAYDFLAAA